MKRLKILLIIAAVVAVYVKIKEWGDKE